jgi:putative ABC transport system permease protein
MTMRSALRDLQWRRRRVVIAVLGTSLVFALTLLLTGMAHGFDFEANRTIHEMNADAWLVRKGAAGPFLGQSPFPQSKLQEARAIDGVRDATALMTSRKVIGEGSPEEVNVFGADGRGVGVPGVDEGRRPRAGEVVISNTLDYHIGQELVLSGKPFTIVGLIHEWTAIAGVPNIYLTLKDAQEVSFFGRPLVSTIAVKGSPRAAPDGLELIDNAQAKQDLLRPVARAKSAISLVAFLLWIVAAAIIGSVIYVSTLERVRDFAVFKATGTSNASILGDLVVQAVLLSIAAAAVGALVATLIAPRFPLPVVIPAVAYVILPLIAAAVGLAASVSGMRRAVRVDPALAFNSA